MVEHVCLSVTTFCLHGENTAHTRLQRFWCAFTLAVCKPNFINSNREVIIIRFYHLVTEQTLYLEQQRRTTVKMQLELKQWECRPSQRIHNECYIQTDIPLNLSRTRLACCYVRAGEDESNWPQRWKHVVETGWKDLQVSELAYWRRNTKNVPRVKKLVLISLDGDQSEVTVSTRLKLRVQTRSFCKNKKKVHETHFC